MIIAHREYIHAFSEGEAIIREHKQGVAAGITLMQIGSLLLHKQQCDNAALMPIKRCEP